MCPRGCLFEPPPIILLVGPLFKHFYLFSDMLKADTDSLAPFLRVAACSYEGSLFGWKITENSEKEYLETKISFGFNLTPGCLKAVAVSKNGKFLCAGGVDERIRIFNLSENKAVGEISTHTGGITCLEFFEDSYLISGSDDCSLIIWRVHDWQCLHILGGHKESVTDFSIHPSGKLALSVSKDSTMKLWNLVQGRCAFTRRLRKPAEKVTWHEAGLHYLLIVHNELQLYLAADNSCLVTIALPTRINQGLFTCVAPKTSEEDSSYASWRIAAVCEDKSLYFYNFEGKHTAQFDLTHLDGGRPRDMWSGYPDLTAVHTEEMSRVLATEGHCLVIGTSTGAVFTLSAAGLEVRAEGEESLVPYDAKNADHVERNKKVLELAVLSFANVKVEPRLTAIVAWNQSTVSKKNKNKPLVDVLAPEVAEIEPAASTEDSSTPNKKKNKKNKNKNKSVTISEEVIVEPVAVKETKAVAVGGSEKKRKRVKIAE